MDARVQQARLLGILLLGVWCMHSRVRSACVSVSILGVRVSPTTNLDKTGLTIIAIFGAFTFSFTVRRFVLVVSDLAFTHLFLSRGDTGLCLEPCSRCALIIWLTLLLLLPLLNDHSDISHGPMGNAKQILEQTLTPQCAWPHAQTAARRGTSAAPSARS